MVKFGEPDEFFPIEQPPPQSILLVINLLKTQPTNNYDYVQLPDALKYSKRGVLQK